MAPVSVFAEPTPNPNAYKFTLNCPVIHSGQKNFSEAHQAEDSPVAKALFKLQGIEHLSLESNFITVTKKSESEWTHLLPKVERAILENVGNHAGNKESKAEENPK